MGEFMDLIKFQVFVSLNFLLLTNSSEKYAVSANFEETDPCYDPITRQAKRCAPNFENVAFKRIPIVSSTCGSPPIRYCIQSTESHNKPISSKHCSICDIKNEPFIPKASYLTDLEQTNQTCWVSGPVYEPTAISNLSIMISFGKKYELTYISLEFCTQFKPDSLAIFKSMDHGQSWIPFQYYSSECHKIYNRPLRAKVTQSNEQEAICSDSHLKFSKYNLNRIGFSTLDGRPSFHDFDRSPVLQDWVTATDIKIVFTRLLSPLVYKNQSLNSANEFKYRIKKQFNKQSRELNTQINDMGYFYTAISEIAIGGRCKCNGHASRCILNREGKYQCDCKHNTAGMECERCLPFHYDRPWARGTLRDANECVACNCNNHSNQCRFNKELYLLSGRRSGGVCINCKHNTAGRFCHYCAQGYYRNFAYSMSNHKACQECNCHMIGSSGKVCNQNTGQCPCKIGVTGLKCDRCKKGFMQTNSALTPCIKLRDIFSIPSEKTASISLLNNQNNYINNHNSYTQKNKQEKNKCDFCKKISKKIKIMDLCKSYFSFVLTLTNVDEQINEPIKTANFDSNLKKGIKKFSGKILGVLKKNTGVIPNFNKNMEISIYFDKNYLNCSCSKVDPRKNYLIIIKDQDSGEFSNSKILSIDFAPLFSKSDWISWGKFEIREWKSRNLKRVTNFLNRKCK